MPQESAVCEPAKAFGRVVQKAAEQKESRIEEGHLLADHVNMMISIPPKYAVSQMSMWKLPATDQAAQPNRAILATPLKLLRATHTIKPPLCRGIITINCYLYYS